MRILVPIDASEASLHAVHHAIRLAWSRPDADVHLLNVRRPLPSAIGDLLGPGTSRRYHEDRAEACLSGAQALLDHSGIPYSSALAVGRPIDSIAAYAAANRCGQIVLGAGRAGSWPDLLFGSLPIGVFNAAAVPVTLVK